MNTITKPVRIALAHDSFTQEGGAERVMEAFHELYPDAPIFTLVLDKKLKEKYKDWDIRTSWLQVLYNFIPKLQYLLPFIPLATSSLDFSGYDLILSSSSGFIKNIKFPKSSIHINYCHTPTRFLWSEPEYVEQEVPKILASVIKILLSWMKKWDYSSAQKVNAFIANSKEVKKRIQIYYNRSSTVIYPGVDTSFWNSVSPRRHSEASAARVEESLKTGKEILHPSDALRAQDDAKEKSYFLLAGRLQAHKNNELIIEVFNELGLSLHVAGTGRQEDYLKSIARPNITFLGKVSDNALRDEYAAALGYIFPQVEDFGLMPLEAAASGTATLAYAKGGALETIIQGQTGEFFESYNKEEIKEKIRNWKPEKYKTDELRKHAELFSKEKFKNNISEFLKKFNENSH